MISCLPVPSAKFLATFISIFFEGSDAFGVAARLLAKFFLIRIFLTGADLTPARFLATFIRGFLREVVRLEQQQDFWQILFFAKTNDNLCSLIRIQTCRPLRLNTP